MSSASARRVGGVDNKTILVMFLKKEILCFQIHV